MSWLEPSPAARTPTARSAWWGLLADAARLSVLRRPEHPARPLDVAVFAGAAALFLFGGLLADDLSISLPRWSNDWAITERSFPILLALALASACAAIAERHAVSLRLAATGLLAMAPAIWLWPWLNGAFDGFDHASWLPAGYLALVGLQTARWGARGSPRLRRASAALLAAACTASAVTWMPYSPWWWADEGEDEASYIEEPLSWSPEALWNTQAERVDAAVAALAPQRPGVIDLYALAMAGDGNEKVFRNEVELLQRTLAERFDAPEHLIALVNHVNAREDYPLASMTNLRQSLDGLSRVMDPEEDILLLFVTSHGSAEHRIHLGLDPLPLDPLDGDSLRASLDAAGIRWRVLVISACYSGGLLPVLQSPESLVITAARADRTSFGCGVQSEITWFGEAFLAEALQQTRDFPEAFRLAKTAIARREREEGIQASFPQIWRGEEISRRLEVWRTGLSEVADPPGASRGPE